MLESLVPALKAELEGNPLPDHVKTVEAQGIRQVKLIDATPIGINIRSTVATYAGIHDELRKVYARTVEAQERGWKAGDFSYNTGQLRCPTCDGTGVISLDVQFLPDVDIPCPDCKGSRYAKAVAEIRRQPKKGGQPCSLTELMNCSVSEALEACRDLPLVSKRLQALQDLGLGYLTLGEDTPGLSGGEAQRLKLPVNWEKAREILSLSLMNPPSVSIPWTSRPCSRFSSVSWIRELRSSSSNTTWT